MKRLLKLMFGDWAEIKLVLFVAIILFRKSFRPRRDFQCRYVYQYQN